MEPFSKSILKDGNLTSLAYNLGTDPIRSSSKVSTEVLQNVERPEAIPKIGGC